MGGGGGGGIFNDDNRATLPCLGQIQDLFGTDLPKIIYLENPVQGREAKNHTLSSGTSASPPVGQIRECSPPPLPNPFPVPASQGSHFLINSFPRMLPALSFPFSRRLHTQLLYSLQVVRYSVRVAPGLIGCFPDPRLSFPFRLKGILGNLFW